MALSETPEWYGKVWRDGGHYRRRGDLREVSGGELPVILHIGNKHDSKADDKIELIETGPMRLSEMKDVIADMYQFAPDQSRVMRLDLCSDIEGTSVDWFRQNTYFRFKQTERKWMEVETSSRRAQTIVSGQKPRQNRIYDKTAHRQMLLASERRKMTREERPFCQSFEQRWGYPETRMITRIERQYGGGEPKEVGFERVRDLEKLAFGYDPFHNLVFMPPRPSRRIESLRPKDRIMLDYLTYLIKVDGLTNARDYVWSICRAKTREGRRSQFYRLWRQCQRILGQATVEGSSREGLLLSFNRSIQRQLAA
jgi:hypothetical protein